MGRQTGRGFPTLRELWPQQPFRKGSWVAAAAGAQARRVQVVSPNDTVRSDTQPQPRRPHAVCTPAHPLPCTTYLGTLGLSTNSHTARACRRHWTRFASVGLIVWYQHYIGCMLYPATPKAHKPRDGNFSLCLHLWLQILLPLSSLPLRKPQDCDIYRQTLPRADRATNDQDIDPNASTWKIIPQHASPASPPLNRVSESRRAQSTWHTAPHHNTTQNKPETAATTAFLVFYKVHHHVRHALLLASCIPSRTTTCCGG